MQRYVGPLLGMSLSALLAACDTNVGMQAGADMREASDMRSSPGNTVLGTVCDDTRTCASDPKTMTVSRCATVVEFDQVGACTPTCEDDKDCDTIVPGLAACTIMAAQGGKKECVVFCDKDKRVMGRECPENWTCVSSQSYRICRPPQTK